MASISSQHFEPVLLDHRQQFERHAAGPLGAGLPLLYRGFAGVQIAREYRLTDMRALADPLDLRRQHHRRHGKTRFVKFAHGRLVDGPGAMQPFGCTVDRLEGVALALGFTLHRIAPVSYLG